MIVISQAWEFVPKGSSHFNYHTNSSTGNACTKLSNELATASASVAAGAQVAGLNAGGAGAGRSGGVEDAAAAASANFRSNQKAKAFGRYGYDRIKVSEDSNNISLNELSFAGYYISKSPVALAANNVQLDLNVSSFLALTPIFLHLLRFWPFHQNEKWHLRQINEYCDKEIYIKDNKVILSYGSDNDSKVINRSYTFDAPIFDVKFPLPSFILSAISSNRALFVQVQLVQLSDRHE